MTVILVAPKQLRSNDKLPQILLAGHQEWVRNTDFFCHFEVFEGPVSTKERAMVVERGQLSPFGSGFYAKMGETVRMRFVPAEAIREVSAGNGGVVRSNVPYDEVSNTWLDIRMEIPTSRNKGAAIYVHGRDEQRYPLTAGTFNDSFLNPLNLASTKMFDPYHFGDHDAGETAEILSKSIDAVTVRVSQAHDNGLRLSRELSYRISHSPPMIYQSTYREEKSNGAWTEIVVTGESFANTDGTLVPNEIRYISSTSYDAKWRVVLWKSEDLGRRAVRESDFVIERPEGMKLLGLKNNELEQINIFEIEPDDLIDSYIVPNSPPHLTSSTSQWIVGFLLLNVVIVMGILFRWYYAKRR